MKIKELQDLIKDLPPDADIKMIGSYSAYCDCEEYSYAPPMTGETEYSSLSVMKIQKPTKTRPWRVQLELEI